MGFEARSIKSHAQGECMGERVGAYPVGQDSLQCSRDDMML